MLVIGWEITPPLGKISEVLSLERRFDIHHYVPTFISFQGIQSVRYPVRWFWCVWIQWRCEWGNVSEMATTWIFPLFLPVSPSTLSSDVLSLSVIIIRRVFPIRIPQCGPLSLLLRRRQMNSVTQCFLISTRQLSLRNPYLQYPLQSPLFCNSKGRYGSPSGLLRVSSWFGNSWSIWTIHVGTIYYGHSCTLSSTLCLVTQSHTFVFQGQTEVEGYIPLDGTPLLTYQFYSIYDYNYGQKVLISFIFFVHLSHLGSHR